MRNSFLSQPPCCRPHPLDPLCEEELRHALRLLDVLKRVKTGFEWNVNRISLREPPKTQILEYEANNSTCIDRVAACILLHNFTNKTYECDISLTKEQILFWREARGNATLTMKELNTTGDIVMASEIVLAELRKRGVTNMKLVVPEPWPVCLNERPDWKNRRLMQVWMYVRVDDEDDNQFAHPLDFAVIVDLHQRQVIEIQQIDIPRPPPLRRANFWSRYRKAEFRKDLKRIEIIQPEGVSFRVTGNLIEWANWRFRVGFNWREGLVLYLVSWNERGRYRPILYRASLAELHVPYGDSSRLYYRKAAFDTGDTGIGICADSLTLGCDCVGSIWYFDAVFVDSGDIFKIPNCVCVHEEDTGMLWKHTEFRNGQTEMRRGRRLVVSHTATVSNYDYGFYWYFYLDGTLSFECKATGILSTNFLPPGADPKGHGVLVSPQVNAQIHQHFFVLRLNPMIDGPRNSIYEVNVVPAPDDDNPYGNAFVFRETLLKNESEAQRNVNSSSFRHWKIVNHSTLNPLTQEPTAWKVYLPATPPLMMKPNSLFFKRSFAASKNLWVTRYNETNEEFFPFGEYTNQMDLDSDTEGIAQYIKNNRSIVDQDIVLWLTFNLCHIPRLEDFPVMPVDCIGFSMKPAGFFVENPTLDLPPTRCMLSVKCNMKEEINSKEHSCDSQESCQHTKQTPSKL